jgi:hypothetical protein
MKQQADENPSACLPIANSLSLWYNLARTALDGGVISHASGSPGSA